MRYVLLLLVLTPTLGAQEPKLRFPAAALKVESFKLTADFLYVVEADTAHLVLDSPQGLVSIEEATGPLRIRGRFVDGTGKPETRTYTGKQIWIVEAVGTGRVELLIVPAGTTKASGVTRKTLDVETGQGPQPPPTRKIAKSLTFLVIGPTVKTAQITEDPDFRAWLKANGINIYGISTKEQLDANPKFVDRPTHSIVLQDADNNVITSVALMNIETIADAKAFVAQYLGK